MADELKFVLTGEDRTASKSLKGVGEAAEAAAKKVVAAKDREAAAQRKVAIEEKRLDEMRESGSRKQSEILQQEDILAQARTRAARATDAVTDATKKLERAEQDAADASREVARELDDVGDAARKAGDQVGDDMKRGFKRAGEGAQEFKDEAHSTAREGAASFTGEFDDVADIIQETLANALAGFGPMGALAGMAAAAGIGILVGELQKSAERADEARDRMSDLAETITDAGGDARKIDWSSQLKAFARDVGDAKEWYEVWQKDSKTNIEVISADAERLGLVFEDVFRGLAGDPEALARALDEVNRKLQVSEDQARELISGGMDPLAAAAQTGSSELLAYRDKLQDAADTTRRAQGQSALLSKVIDKAAELENTHTKAIQGSTDAIEKWNDAQDEKLDKLKQEAQLAMDLDDAEAAWAEQVSGSKAAVKEVADAIDKRTKATREASDAVTADKASWDLHTESGRLANDLMLETSRKAWTVVGALREQGASSKELEARTAQLREQFIQTAGQMGMNRQAAEQLANKYGLIPREISTTVIMEQPDLTAWRQRLQARVAANPMYVPSTTYGAPVARASGGPVSRGQLYKVGEQGEELFVPKGDGTIIPADQTRRILDDPTAVSVGAGAGGLSLDGVTFVLEIPGLAPALNAHVQRVLSDTARGLRR